MLLTDHALELSAKSTMCEQILGNVLQRASELCPEFATIDCKKIHQIDARDLLVTGIESLENSTNGKFWFTLSYPKKGYIRVQFLLQNPQSGVISSHDILSFVLDNPCSKEELISRTDKVLKTTGLARESLRCDVA